MKQVIVRSDGTRVPLFYHPFNCGDGSIRTTERSVELALAFQWLERVRGEVIEVGAVTPYYLDTSDLLAQKISLVIDPQDPRASLNGKYSLFQYNFTGHNVLSISTLEHVGMGQYELPIGENCISAVEKIMDECCSCFITTPIGFNRKLDDFLVIADWPDANITIIHRSPGLNDWKESADRNLIEVLPYSKKQWANGIVVIERNDSGKRGPVEWERKEISI